MFFHVSVHLGIRWHFTNPVWSGNYYEVLSLQNAKCSSREQLLSVYQLRVRSTLEFAAPVFHTGLTQDQSRQVEMVQKKAFAIILGRNYESYESALETLQQERLDTRRTTLCSTFAFKCTKSPQHHQMFPLNPDYRENMRHRKKYKEHQCKTSPYYKSPVPYMARLLNKSPRPWSFYFIQHIYCY